MYRKLKFGHFRIVSSTAKWFPENIKFGTASWSGGTTGGALQVEEHINVDLDPTQYGIYLSRTRSAFVVHQFGLNLTGKRSHRSQPRGATALRTNVLLLFGAARSSLIALWSFPGRRGLRQETGK
jgi:hypothetical protein